jgi:hypothetical protein
MRDLSRLYRATLSGLCLWACAAAAQGPAGAATEPYQVTVQARVVFGSDGRAQSVRVVDADTQPAAFTAAVQERLSKARIPPPTLQDQPATLATGVSMFLQVTPGASGGQVRVLGLQMHPLSLAMRLVAMPDDAFLAGETERQVTVVCEVDVQGRCAQASAQGLPGVPESVRRWARLTTENWRFEPQTLNGEPIPGRYEVTLVVTSDPSLMPEDFRQSKFERTVRGR